MSLSAARIAAPAATPRRDDDAFIERDARRDRALGFVARIHALRTLALGLCMVCVASVLWLHGAPWYIWTLLVAHALAWPHVARALALRSAHPVRAELRHLALDSALGGAWVALMHFNLLPSVLFVTMLTVDKIAVDARGLLLRASACLAGTCAATSAVLGFPVDIATRMPVIVACIPFLVAYPIAIGVVMRRLARRVAEQTRWLAKVSTTDELTGLANRRQGLAAAAQAMARFRRRGGDAVLMIVDIDRFKDINDRHGHPAGDAVLRDVAKVLVDNIRITDTAARYAGDEFLLVLPDTSVDGAAEMANRIRACFSAALARIPGANCSVSLGAAAAYEDMADVEDWIQQADAALYRAKEAGRDRFVAAPRVEVTTRREEPDVRHAVTV